MAIIFDAASKRIILDATLVDVDDVYSRWKEWVKEGDNAKYLPAFSVVGGDPLGSGLFVASYFFLLNGWRLRPMEADQTLELKGNISVFGGGIPVVQTLGDYNVSVQFTVPVAAQGISIAGGGGGSTSEIVAAMLSALSPTISKINQLTFTEPGKVDATCEGGSMPPIMTWNGSQWVEA